MNPALAHTLEPRLRLHVAPHTLSCLTLFVPAATGSLSPSDSDILNLILWSEGCFLISEGSLPFCILQNQSPLGPGCSLWAELLC